MSKKKETLGDELGVGNTNIAIFLADINNRVSELERKNKRIMAFLNKMEILLGSLEKGARGKEQR